MMHSNSNTTATASSSSAHSRQGITYVAPVILVADPRSTAIHPLLRTASPGKRIDETWCALVGLESRLRVRHAVLSPTQEQKEVEESQNAGRCAQKE